MIIGTTNIRPLWEHDSEKHEFLGSFMERDANRAVTLWDVYYDDQGVLILRFGDEAQDNKSMGVEHLEVLALGSPSWMEGKRLWVSAKDFF